MSSSSQSEKEQNAIRYSLILAHLQAGSVSAALSFLNKMTDADHIRYVDALLRVGRVQQAQQYLESIPDLSTDDLVQYSTCLIRLGQFSTAIQKSQLVLSSNPNLYIAHMNLACALVYSGDPDQAVSILEECIRKDPSQALRQPYFTRTLQLMYEVLKPNPVAELDLLSQLTSKFCPDLNL